MLEAEKSELEAWTRVSLLNIRQRELQLYSQNTHNLGVVGSIVAGIAYFGLLYCRTNVQFFNDSSEWQKGAYGIALVACLGLSLRVCFATMLVVMFGPGTALRSSSNALFHNAVEGMRIEFEYASYHLHAAVHTSLFTVVVYAWSAASPHWLCSVLVSVIAGTFSSLIVRQVGVLDRAFPVRNMQLTSGAFHIKQQAQATRAAHPEGRHAAGGQSRAGPAELL